MTHICFIIPCMGRLKYLQQILPHVVTQQNTSCAGVDYVCPEHSGDWAESRFPQVKVVRVVDKEFFDHSYSRNRTITVYSPPAATRTPKHICGNRPPHTVSRSSNAAPGLYARLFIPRCSPNAPVIDVMSRG